MNKRLSYIILGYFIIFPFFSSPFAQNDTLKAEQYVKEAKALYYDGDYKKSLKTYRKALKIRERIYDPNHKKIWKIYQRMGKANRRLRTHQEALNLFNKGLEMALKTEEENSVDVGDFYLGMGFVYSQMYRPDKANEYYQKTLEIYQEQYGEESPDVGNVIMLFGNTSLKMGNYADADKYYRKAQEIFNKSSKPGDKHFYRIYNNHGLLFRKTGDYERSLEYANKALELKLEHYTKDHESVAKYYSNIGNIYKDKGDYEEALKFFITSRKIKEKALGKNHPETAGNYGAEGDMYAELGQYKKALKLYKKSIKILEKKLRPNHPYLLVGYFNIGQTYEDMKDYDKALDFYTLTLRKFNENVYIPKQLSAEAQERIAAVYFAKGNIKEALINIRSSIARLAKDFSFSEEDMYSNPKIEGIQAELDFLKLLSSKSKFLEGNFEKTKEPKNLEAALETSFLAIELVEKMRRGHQTESAKTFLNSDTAPIYERAVKQAFDLYEQTKNIDYLFKAFEVSERSKASILWQNINAQYALESSAVTIKTTNTLQAINDEIANLEFDLKNAEDTLIRQDLENQVFKLKLSYEKSILKLENENPDYYQLKYAPAIVKAGAVIDHLPSPKHAVIEYFYTSEELFIFLCTKDGLKGFRKKLSFDLDAVISVFRKTELKDLITTQKQSEEYAFTIDKLHRLLIAPISPSLSTVENLIIIPHGSLQLLSFEMLAPLEDDFRKMDFLLKKFNIQYTWSAGLWAKAMKKTAKAAYPFAGFAPVFNNDKKKISQDGEAYATRNILTPLRSSPSEVAAGKTYFDGKVFTEKDALKSSFLTLASKSNILHLATHATADDHFPEQSGLFFAKEADGSYGFLSLSEVYNLNLDASLAVMSACNTGYGQLAKGEGVMSLGRAFLYAGCKSIVVSLWLANDLSTSEIVNGFYKYAATGMTKNEALRLAKLDYLAEADALTAHPYFWANLVAVGDMAPIQKEEHKGYFIFVFCLLGIGLLLWGRRFWWG